MRMCRSEKRILGESSGRDIDQQIYFEWHDRVLKAMRLWRQKQVSDDELLRAVKELD